MTIDFAAFNYLAAFDRDLPFETEMIYRDRLKLYNLNYSINSLQRIDQLLDDIRCQDHPQEQDFLDDQTNYSFLHLLCFYVGEVIGRARGTPYHWYNYAQMVERAPGHEVFGDAFYTSACCEFPSCPDKDGGYFLPLNAIMTRLFEEDGGKSVIFSAGIFLPPVMAGSPLLDQPLAKVPPMDLGILMSRQPEKLSEEDQQYLKMAMPRWAIHDDIAKTFKGADQLIRTGKIVWAALIQANNALFEIGDSNHGGEIVYDPQGRIAFNNLQSIASHLYRLKGKKDLEPEQQYIGDYLENERIRVFGLDVPATMLPYPLKISTTFFDRKHLPDGLLSENYFPILVDATGIAIVVPSRYWSDSLRQQWLAISAPKREAYERKTRLKENQEKLESEIFVKDDHIMGVVRRRVAEPERLFRLGVKYFQGDGVQQDYTQAHQYWFESGQHGHSTSLYNLGVLYEHGKGVSINPIQAFKYYLRAATLGNADGQLQVGLMYIKGMGINQNISEGKAWVTKSADQDNLAAQKQLQQWLEHDHDGGEASYKHNIAVRLFYSLWMGCLLVIIKILDLILLPLNWIANKKTDT